MTSHQKEITKSIHNVSVIFHKKNLGYAGACNVGAEASKNNFLIFLNNDTEVTEDWLDLLVEKLTNESISSVQPKIKNMNNKDYFDYAGGSGGYIDIFCYPFCRGRIFNTIEKDTLQYQSKEEIFWASGTAFATKKEIFIKAEHQKHIIGGLREESLNQLLKDIGFINISFLYHWYIGQAQLVNDQNIERKSRINNANIMHQYLTKSLPLSRHLFKYIGFIATKP